jgi:ribosomal protein S18 acetylase RimI-like enzyme
VRYELHMTDPIVIRPAHVGDSDFVAGLVSSLLQFGSPAWENAEVLAPGFRDVLVDAVRAQDSRATVLIAEGTDGRPLGFISLKIRVAIGGTERGHVADLAVSEDARRIGVGQALMEAGEAWARERGLRVLSLDVWSTNQPALAFYRALGYRPESLCLIKALD